MNSIKSLLFSLKKRKRDFIKSTIMELKEKHPGFYQALRRTRQKNDREETIVPKHNEVVKCVEKKFSEISQDSLAKQYDLEFWGNLNQLNMLSNVLWDAHHFNCCSFYSRSHEIDSELYDNGYILGDFADDEFLEVKELVQNASEIAWDQLDTHAEYKFSAGVLDQKAVKDLIRYYQPTDKILTAIGRLIDRYIPFFEKKLGHHFNIPQLWIKDLLPVPLERVSANWHTDYWPPCLKKIMIYVDGAGDQQGSTKIVSKRGGEVKPEGGPGTWVLFENSVVTHRADPAVSKRRPTIELTVAPSLETKTKPQFQGLNTNYPWFPLEEEFSEKYGEIFRRDEVLNRIGSQVRELSELLGVSNVHNTYKAYMNPFS